MKRLSFFLILIFSTAFASERGANTIVLDERGVKNLGIEFATAEETDFEESIFALGRVEQIPEKQAVLSSRIPGRVAAINAHVGDQVEAGQELVRIESRQAGDPPPSIVLKAPIAGVVSESHVRLGEPVDPDKELLDILDLREVWAVARVPEHHAGRLEPGKTTAHIRVPALGPEFLTGTLLRLGTAADRESGSIDAIFRVPNPDMRLRPGMRAEFSIVTELRKNVMSVPREAIQGDPSNRIVYVKDFDLPNAFVRTSVQLGTRNEKSVEIKSGLFPGDEVVTKGSYLLGSAGGGGISLKEALDAAHGHEHNEDGSELTAEQKAGKSGGTAATGHKHAEGSPLTLILGIACAVLLALLILTIARQRKAA